MKRVALVTGASRGIGAAAALRLAEDGADVAVQYNGSKEAAEAVAEACRRHGGRALAVQADLRRSDSLSRLRTELETHRFAPNVVVHCAGLAHYALIDDTDEEIWDDLMHIHLKSAYRLTRLFAPDMTWNRFGRFVYLSSVWGVVGAAGEAAYAASKGGLNAFAKSMAKELASSGVTVNAIAPGAIDTDMLAQLSADERAALCREIPLGRLGQADEVAQLIRFLVSDEAGYATGQVIGLNGGWGM